MKMLADNPLMLLAAAMLLFLGAASSLRAYAGGSGIGWVVAALLLYCVGNLMMVPLMKANGMAVATAASAVLQLLMASLVAVIVFGERLLAIQWAGIGLGTLAVVFILWPQLVKS